MKLKMIMMTTGVNVVQNTTLVGAILLLINSSFLA